MMKRHRQALDFVEPRRDTPLWLALLLIAVGMVAALLAADALFVQLLATAKNVP
jgi:hypothetical protein